MTMPMNLHPQYITDENGNKISVVLPIEEFNIILDDSSDSLQTKLNNNSFAKLQIDSMSSTWDNDKDKVWDEL